MSIVTSFLGFIRKNPFLFLTILLILFIILSITQCQSNHKLKQENKAKDEQIRLEAQRATNNLKALNDTITYLRDDSVYTKQIIAAKQGEIEHLDSALADAVANVKTIVNTKIKEVPKLVYITDINSNITTTDVMTKVENEGDSIGIGINMSNPILSIRTRTWFNLDIDTVTRKVNINLLNYYGPNLASQLFYALNFRLTIAQTEAADGTKRLYIKPTDLFGNAIDPTLLGINNIKGVDFIDIPSAPQAKPQKKAPMFTLNFGPQLGVSYYNGRVQPYFGVGFGFGLNVLR